METKELTLFEGSFESTPVMMSSREIAFLTGKEHRNVLRDCDELNESYENLGLPKIGESTTETVILNGITYEVYDTPPEGFTPCRTAASPSGRHTLYSNGVPRYFFDGKNKKVKSTPPTVGR